MTALTVERYFPSDMVMTSNRVIVYRAQPTAIEMIRGKLKAEGFNWTEAEARMARRQPRRILMSRLKAHRSWTAVIAESTFALPEHLPEEVEL